MNITISSEHNDYYYVFKICIFTTMLLYMSNFVLSCITLIYNKVYSSYKIYKNVKSISRISCCCLCKSVVSISY